MRFRWLPTACLRCSNSTWHWTAVRHRMGVRCRERQARAGVCAASAGLRASQARCVAQRRDDPRRHVTLVSGGMPVPGLVANVARFVQLPPVAAADLGFKSLVDEHGRTVDDAHKQARRDRLLALLHELRPHAVVIELFPFGRRQMRFELLPLLDAARASRPAPVIVSSVRDVLGGSRDAERQLRMLAYFDQYFDHLLVHGDPALVRLDQTFAHVQGLGRRLHYTGYVVDRSFAVSPDPGVELCGQDEVIVSAGGGAVGRGNMIAPLAPVAVPSWWRRCRWSISQAGYNTVIETLQAGVRAVMVPFAGGSETEQRLRARVLAEHAWIDIVEEPDLTPLSLAQAINRASRRARLRPGAVALDGADASARLIAEWTDGGPP